MNRLPNERRGVVADFVAHPFGKVLGELGDLGLDEIGGFQGVGVGQEEDGHVGRRKAVDARGGVQAFGGQLGAADVLEPDEGSGWSSPHDEVLEVLGGGQSPLGRDGQLVRLARDRRRLADLPGGDRPVLLSEGRDDIAGGHVAVSELLRIEPDPHAILLPAERADLADAGQAGQFLQHVEGGVVAQVELVELAGWTVHGDREQDVRRLLPSRDARLFDHVRQSGHRQGHAVLHEDLGHVQVHVVLEGHVQAVLAVVGALRGHVHHALDAVDLLFDRRRDRLRDVLGAGAGEAAHDRDARRRNLWVHRQRQVEQRHGARQRDDDGQDRREDRPIDEKSRDHIRHP